MSGKDWLPFYPAAFWEDEDVVALSNEAVGLYLWLLCRQWNHYSLPQEPGKLRALCPRWASTWDALWAEVEHLFGVEADGRRRNPRMKVEVEKRVVLSEAGTRGAALRWKNGVPIAPPMAPLKAGHCETAPEANAQTGPDRTLPDREDKTAARSARVPLNLKSLDGTSLGTDAFRVAWSGWEAFHGKYKAQGLKGQLTRMAAWGEPRAVAALRYSLAQEYEGIHEERGGGSVLRHQGGGSRVIPEKKQDERSKDLAERAAWNEWRVIHPERRPSAAEIASLIEKHLEAVA